MPNAKRPRVAAIGLDVLQLEAIEPLCGEVRPVDSLADYLENYSWSETDIVVSGALEYNQLPVSVNLLTIGPTSFEWTDRFRAPGVASWGRHRANTRTQNTERELAVSPECPDLYRPLAAELTAELRRAPQPPLIVTTTRDGGAALIETTSGHPVALRFTLPRWQDDIDGKEHDPIALLLPEDASLVAWFQAFLSDIHDLDPSRIPHAPPRLSQPADWYTPDERAVATRVAEVESELERLLTEREQLQEELSATGEKANTGIRRALWADGEALVEAIAEIACDLGFAVHDMDAELQDGAPKREDLRLTLEGVAEWGAIVEVKGYSSGTRTNDARQLREHRERYQGETGQLPDLTLWLCNPYREMDPSSRPTPDQNVHEAAENIGAVHVLATDLYRQWALVAAGSLDAEVVVQSLMDAEPGLWTPPGADAGR